MRYTVELVVPDDCEVERVADGAAVDVERAVGEAASGPNGHAVSLAGETFELEVDEDEYVLWAARNAGVWLPADCQQGWCCRCAGELRSGELDQTDSRRYFEEDRDAALHLLCTATPASDCRIRVCQYEAMLEERASHDLPPGRSKR